MGKVYLVRHGQADRLSSNYDQLTELGRLQAKSLGSYFSKLGIEFDACFTGTLVRQKQTADEILSELKKDGHCIPLEIQEDPHWNEFESRLWLHLAGKIREIDPQFSKLYDQFKALQEKKEPDAISIFQKLIQRIILDWTEEKWKDSPPYTFLEYCARIKLAIQGLPKANSILVVSSATPVAISFGIAVKTPEKQMLPYMKNIHNTSLSIYEKDLENWEVISFNSLPHLQVRELITIG